MKERRTAKKGVEDRVARGEKGLGEKEEGGKMRKRGYKVGK